jgi:hypothetical protein
MRNQKANCKKQKAKMNWFYFCNLPFAFCLLIFIFSMPVDAQTKSISTNTSCEFDKEKLLFVGTPLEQAKCLLRPVKIYGALEPQPENLPQPFEKLIGNVVKIDKKRLRAFLQNQNIREEDIGGSLDDRLSAAKLPSGKVVQARYFMLHDVSAPNYLDQPFPENVNEASWLWNDLEKKWKHLKVAHLFINRLGDSVTTVEFNSALPGNNYGTKFARNTLKEDAKGLQIHVELVQPRRSEPTGPAGNDGSAPTPGFTQAQYDRLALVYLAASVRRGRWLIPAYHAAMDAGIPNAHDDPQNFDLQQWANSLDELLKKLSNLSR